MESIFWSDIGNLDTSKGLGIALGNFDGLHQGHMKLINTVIEKSTREGLSSLVYTFAIHPVNVISNKKILPILTTNTQKSELLKNTKLDYLYFESFDESFMLMSAEDFVKKILVDKFNVKIIVVGFDYRFGYKGAGDVNLLNSLAKIYGFKVYVIEPVKLGDTIISSSVIRRLIACGDVEQASTFLNRNYSIIGTVVKGKELGRKIGFPTINIIPKSGILIPANGVYASNVVLNGKKYNSITNVGTNPTVGDIGIRIETHIIDYSGSLYGEEVEVFFLKKIRDERKFNSLEELIEQIKKDKLMVRS